MIDPKELKYSRDDEWLRYEGDEAFVGITDYVNSVVSHTDLGSKLTDQFQRNQMPIQSADFDAESGNLDTVFSNESDPNPDTNLTPKDKLDIEISGLPEPYESMSEEQERWLGYYLECYHQNLHGLVYTENGAHYIVN